MPGDRQGPVVDLFAAIMEAHIEKVAVYPSGSRDWGLMLREFSCFRVQVLGLEPLRGAPSANVSARDASMHPSQV